MNQKLDLSDKRVSPENLKRFCVEAMLKCGLKEKDAVTTAEVLVTTDTWGVHTHGTKQLRNLLKCVRSGGVNSKAVPEVISEGPAWAIVDGHFAMPMVSSCLAMETAIKKAKTAGIGYAGVKHSSHFGAAGYYANMAVGQGLFGLAVTNVDPCMTVPGSKGAVLGTNPIAYAVPAGKEKPVFLDIATSTVAASKVFAARDLKKKIPDNWLVDEEGVSTTDPNQFPRTGALLPMSGHKGYGLALMVEILAGVLTGAGVTAEVKSWILDFSEPTNQGHAFIAIDVGAIMPIRQFKDQMDRLIREIKEAPKAKGSERIYLPGEMEWEKRDEVLKSGIRLPEDVIATLTGLAEDLDLKLNGLFG